MLDYICTISTMAPRVLIFAGAPMSSSLNWESDILLESVSAQITRFFGLDTHQQLTPQSTSSHACPPWRSLRLGTEALRTYQFQTYASSGEYRGDATASFDAYELESTDRQVDIRTSPRESAESTESQFYEDSLAVYENLPSSPIQALEFTEETLPPSTNTGYTTSNATSFSTSLGFSFNSHITPSKDSLPIPNGGRISDLANIPNSGYLQSIQPQTMTVNVIVGIISISQPQRIKTQRGASLEIVELLVGDETRSGFGINCWLPTNVTSKNIHNHHELRRSLTGLRPQDIILLQNVALSSFRGKVYGQSLRRNVTKVDLLFRNRIDREDKGGCYGTEDLKGAIGSNTGSQLAKTMRVREWVLRFVGHGTSAMRRTAMGKVEAVSEILPPDTQ